MAECAHIMFGDNNYNEIATITSTPEPVNDINLLKNHYRSRQTRWTNLDGDIVIEGVLPEQKYASYFAIAGSNLSAYAQVKLEIFTTDVSSTDLLQQDFISVGEIIPLGAWRAGVDPYGDANNSTLNNMQMIWFNQWHLMQRYRLTIKHGYTAAAGETTTPATDGIYRQDANGLVSIEAEAGEVVDNSLDSWSQVTNALSSDGVHLTKDGAGFYWNYNEGPRVNFRFTPSQTGVHNVWLRVSGSVATSVFTVYGNAVTTLLDDPVNFIGQGWQWVKTRDIYLNAENKCTVGVVAREAGIAFDKIVIQPNGTAAPTGMGPAVSGFGSVLISDITGEPIVNDSDHVSLRMLILGNTMKLEKNFAYGSKLRYLTNPDLTVTSSGFSEINREQRKARALSLDLTRMTESDRLALSRMETKLVGKPFIVSAYPGSTGWFADDYTFLGRFASALDYTHFQHQIHQTNLNILEV